jgi:drug/metabolite transporter (DMT)-like permease
MVFLKASVAGLGAAILAAALWVVGWIFVPMWIQQWKHRNEGFLGASSVGSGSTFTVALLAFLLVFYMVYRRYQN